MRRLLARLYARSPYVALLILFPLNVPIMKTCDSCQLIGCWFCVIQFCGC